MKTMIGLEIHVHILSKSKLFCSCLADNEKSKPNSSVCEICSGQPGAKPMLNRKIIDSAMTVAMALNCSINRETFFSRKTYFYPDMPKNYQITQYEVPLAVEGLMDILGKQIRIRRIHVEEDPGKLIHVGGDITSARYVLIDYNRSGIPLIEIVTEPDFENTKEVREFLSKLRSILEHLEVYDSSKEASLRVDANISVDGGSRVEIKNITGFANVEKALNYEIARQQSLARMGIDVTRETRHFDADANTTASLRKKEFEEDYGYIFEPDLPMIEISDEWMKGIADRLPELPDARVARFVEKYMIARDQSKVIVYLDKALADFFEDCVKLYNKPSEISKWIVTDLLKSLNWNSMSLRQSKVRAETFVELLRMIESGEITARLAKELIKEYAVSGENPKDMVKSKSVSTYGEKELGKIIDDAIKENTRAADDYKKGNLKSLQYLLGEVLKKTGKAADPKLIRKLLEARLAQQVEQRTVS